jgi:ADP-heptose:LPS heptosyltransferase
MKKILKQIEIVFRHVFVYPFFNLILRNKIRNEVIKLKTIHKLLILRDDGIGDMIVSTPIFRKLKETHPNMQLDVFASLRNADIIKHNPFVDKIFLAHKNIWALGKELLRARAEHYDVVINFVFNRTTSEGLAANIIAPAGMKIGQGLDKYQFYFNRLLRIERTENHMVKILAALVDDVFGTDYQQQALSPEVFIDDWSQKKVDLFLHQHRLNRRAKGNGNGSYVIINYSAIDPVRRLSIEQTVEIAKTLHRTGKDTPIVIYPPGGHQKLQGILSLLDQESVIIYPESGVATLLELASLIGGARYVVTCDTSIVHFAAAAKTSVFVLFTPTAALNHEWLPYGVKNKCLYAKLGLGVDSIPIELITKELAIFDSVV